MKISAMVNLGEKYEKRLVEVGIHDADVLKEIGAVEAAVRMKREFPDVDVDPVRLEGAIRAIRWQKIPKEEKKLIVEKFEEGCSRRNQVNRQGVV